MAKKKTAKKNPARAFALETEIKKGRQKKVKGAAKKASSASRVGDEVSGASLRRKLAKINPGHYVDELPRMSDAELARERKSLQALIVRAHGHSETTRMAQDLTELRGEIDKEFKRRRLPNPVSSGRVTDKTLAQYASAYRRKHKKYLDLVTSRGSSHGEIARAKKQFDDAERRLILYAEVRNMDPIELQNFIEHASKRQRSAKKKSSRRSNPSPSAVKIDERSIELSKEMPSLGTLGAYPRAAHMWESVYINARVRGSSKERARMQAWGAVKNEGYYQDTKGVWRMPRRRFNPGERPKENPLKKIPRGATERQARTIISKNISTEMDAGRPQRQAVAIALSSARRDSPKLMAKMYGESPKENPKKPTRKVTPEWKRLTNRCQKLWGAYCEKPTKKNLRAVLEHLEKMKSSKSEKVKKERSACLRVANREAKRLKLK